MAVVCAGPKAILDVPATLEYLETRGVPVIAVGQAELPGFFARSAGVLAPDSVPDVRGAAEVVATQLGLGLRAGIVVCVPVPAEAALPDDVAQAAVERAVHDADEAAIAGPALTPWLLARIAALTEGASIRANTALIVNDARVAGELATLLAALTGRYTRPDWRLPGTSKPSSRGSIERTTGAHPEEDAIRMRIYEGSPRQDFEEVFRSMGAFIDQRGMKDVLLVEAPDGYIVQGLVVSVEHRQRLVRDARARRPRRP